MSLSTSVTAYSLYPVAACSTSGLGAAAAELVVLLALLVSVLSALSPEQPLITIANATTDTGQPRCRPMEPPCSSRAVTLQLEAWQG